MRTMGALAAESFVRITKLSNGYVVHYQKASMVKRANPIFRAYQEARAMGVSEKMDRFMDKALEKFGEGEEWRGANAPSAPKTEPSKYVDTWVLEERAIACLTEADVAKTFAEAVKAQTEIEQLYADGKFGSAIGVGDVIGCTPPVFPPE